MSDASPTINGSTKQSTSSLGHNLLQGGVPSEGNRTISWIWRDALGDVSSTPGFHECMYTSPVKYLSNFSPPAFRIEWSKARARSERWREEVMILREEMRRVLVSLRSSSDMWTARGTPSCLLLLSNDPIVREGITAYADHQSHIFASLRGRFDSIWRGLEKGDKQATESVSVMSEEALLQLQGGDI